MERWKANFLDVNQLLLSNKSLTSENARLAQKIKLLETSAKSSEDLENNDASEAPAVNNNNTVVIACNKKIKNDGPINPGPEMNGFSQGLLKFDHNYISTLPTRRSDDEQLKGEVQ